MNPARIPYNFAVLRVVPHVFTGAFVNVGVILHAPTAQHLDMRVLRDLDALRGRVADVDLDLLVKYLRSCEDVSRGEESAGPVALLPPSERFHWLTAPRSDVIQSSPIHSGLATDLGAELEALYRSYVEQGERPLRP